MPAPPRHVQLAVKNAQDHEPGVYVLSRSALREMDRLAAEEYGLPTIVLMENAALHCSDVALGMLEAVRDASVLVVCGTGSNGGDGLAVARHLHNAGLRMMIAVIDPGRAQGDALVQLRVVRRMGLAIRETGDDSDAGLTVRSAADELCGRGTPDLIIDALFGTGLSRPVVGPALDAIREINRLAERGSKVLSIDVPSGLDADTGEPLGDAVRAGITVSLAAFKRGFLQLSAQSYLGDVIVADIGAPRELLGRLGEPLPDLPPAKRKTGARAAPRRGETRRPGG